MNLKQCTFVTLLFSAFNTVKSVLFMYKHVVVQKYRILKELKSQFLACNLLILKLVYHEMKLLHLRANN